MARYTHEKAAEAVTAALQAAGGSATHNELVAALESSGNAGAVPHLITLQSTGLIRGQVVAVSPGVNELRYSVVGGAVNA